MVRKRKIVIFASFALLSANLPTSSAWAGAPAGKIVSVTGTALIRSDQAGTKTSEPAKPGVVVHEGDVINTPSDGKVKILLKDETIIDIGPSALFKVTKFEKRHGGDRHVELSMLYGKVRTAVTQSLDKKKGSFRLHTPTAVMGVRGTEFIVSSQIGDMKEVAQALKNPEKTLQLAPGSGKKSSDGAPAPKAKTEITVVQGKVEVAKPSVAAAAHAAPVVALTAGTQLVVATDTKPAAEKPITLTPEQLTSVASAAKVEDNTFTNAVTVDLSKNSDSGGPSPASIATQAILATALAGPPPAAPTVMGNSGFAGTFGAQNVFVKPPVQLVPGGIKNIRVVIQR